MNYLVHLGKDYFKELLPLLLLPNYFYYKKTDNGKLWPDEGIRSNPLSHEIHYETSFGEHLIWEPKTI